jgi:translocation and assembly module TamB
MTESGPKPRLPKLWKYFLLVILVGLLVLAGLAWYTTTDSFQAAVRRRLVSELERITGGGVELGEVHTTPFRLRAEIRDLTIHGREAPGEVPYAHVGRLLAELKIVSLLETEFGFNSVVLEHPVIHIATYPDGSTNQPQPELLRAAGRTPIEELLALSIESLELRKGEFVWDEHRIPLDFVAHDVSADMTYSLLQKKYDGKLLLGKADANFDGYRPVAWTAEAHFSLAQTSLEVKSLTATSGRSRLQASGRIDDFHNPKIIANYQASIDLAEAAALARRPEVRRGILQLEGEGAWSATGFSTSGNLLAKAVDWREPPLGLQGASLNARFFLDQHRLGFSQIQGHMLGGDIAGNAEVTQWLLPAQLAKGKKPEEQTGAVNLRIKDLSMSEVAAAFSTRSRPFHRMNLVGAASGRVEAHWKRSPSNAEAELLLGVVPPAHPASNQLPLTARARGTYRAAIDELELSEFAASTRATQVRASGRLSRSSNLQMSLNTTNLGEWQPVLSAAGYQERIPITLQGRASFNGNGTGKLSDIAFAGNLQSQDFDVLIQPSGGVEKRVHWDSLIANVQLSPHLFAARNAVLRRGSSEISFDVSAGLRERQLTEASPFTARIDVKQADAAEVLALAGYEYPLTGTINLHIRAAGTRADPQGDGTIQIADAILYGESFQRITAGLHFHGGEAQFTDIQLVQQDARVAGEATYNLSTHTFRLNATGTNFDLARISTLQGSRVSVEGRMGFTAVGSGTLEEPVINATLNLYNLTFDHELAGDFTIDAATQGPGTRIIGRSQFKNAELQIDGNIHLRGDWPANLSLHFNHLDADSLLHTYLRGRITGHSSLAGDAQLEGPLKQPRELRITANLTDLFADVENIKMRNDGPLRFSISRQLLKIDQFHLVGEGTDLSANGDVQLNGERQLNLSARGRINLRLIESFNPDFTSSGLVTVDVNVSSTAAKPVMQGKLQVDNGAIAYIDLPSALSAINGSLVFNQDRLQIENLTARTGGGLITLGGYATSYNRQLNFNLTVRGEGVRLRYPPGVSSTADADLHFAGTTAASTLTGEITVNKLAMTPGFDFGAYLERTAQTSALPQTNPLLNRIRLDVHIATAPELQMQTAIVRLSGDADLHMRGTAAKPVLLGRADVIEGEVYFNGTKYRLERGDVTFTNPVTTTPVLDLQASTRVRDYDITLNLNGPIDRPNLTYRSEPPLPTADIIALLAFGQTTQQSAQLQQSNQTAFSQEASSAILNAALNATVSNRAQRLFGVSRIKINPQGLATETSPTQTGPAVTIEQQVKDNLTLTYTTNVSQTSQQIIQVEYNITRNLSVVGVRDQNGVVSFDVRIRQRKK